MAIFAWPEVAILSGVHCNGFSGVADIYPIPKLKFSIKKAQR